MRPPPSAPRVQANDPKSARTLRLTILALILELTFEGLARKLSLSGANIAIFLLKDVIVAAIGFQIVRLKRPAEIDFLWIAYLILMVLFLPVIIATSSHDAVLAVFGAKEYLLYPLVAFGVYIGFENATVTELVAFFRWIALLVIPTALIALLQLRLPPDHWLNLSVAGDSLEGFSAGGHLRVSSTFPFVAQYCAFIDAEVFIVALALNSLRDVGWLKKAIYLSTIPLLLISSYVTGSRGAVLGCTLIVLIGSVLCMVKFPSRNIVRMGLIISGLLLTFVVSRYVFPMAFEAYADRERGQMLGASTEIQQRIYSSMFDWMSDIFTTPFFGNGIGVMSNGSEMLSQYATITRESSWTETDFATTLFEGGVYLVVIWYGFRYFVIAQVLRHFLGMKREDLSLPNAFAAGFVVIAGLTGTLAIQPPIAIWFWLAVGTSLVIWRKSVESEDGPKPSGEPPAPAMKPKARGQSAYAERLHAR